MLELRLGRMHERPLKQASDIFATAVRIQQEKFFDLSTGDLIDRSVALTPDFAQQLISEQRSAAARLENELMKLFFSEFDAR